MNNATTAKGLSPAIVQAALDEAGGSPVRAARALGVTRNTVLYWMDRAGLERNRNCANCMHVVSPALRKAFAVYLLRRIEQGATLPELTAILQNASLGVPLDGK